MQQGKLYIKAILRIWNSFRLARLHFGSFYFRPLLCPIIVTTVDPGVESELFLLTVQVNPIYYEVCGLIWREIPPAEDPSTEASTSTARKPLKTGKPG